MYRKLLCASATLLMIGSISTALSAAEDESKSAASEGAVKVTPAKQFADIQNEYNNAMREFRTAYDMAAKEARENEDRAAAQQAMQKIYQEKFPNPSDCARKFLVLAEENPEDPVALKALGWIVQRAGGTPESDAALRQIAENHIQSDQLLPIVMAMTRAQPSEFMESFLGSVADENPDGDTKGIAKYALAKYVANLSSIRGTIQQKPAQANLHERRYGKELFARLMDRTTEELETKVESLFQDVIANHGNVRYGRRTLADIVEGELFEIKYLAIGKVAPDIEGEDLDGVEFKLSDYRGKVVVIDFWGDW